MDVFENVRQLGPSGDGTDEGLVVARERLAAAIAAETPERARRTRRTTGLVIGGLLGAAAAATATILVISSIAPPPRVEAAPVPVRTPVPTSEPSPAPSPSAVSEPSAAEVLAGAAASAAAFTPPALGPGQYLRHAWTEQTLFLVDPDPASSGWAEPGMGGDRAVATGGWSIQRSGSDYSPSDPNADWYREWGAPSIIETIGAADGMPSVRDALLQRYGQGQGLFRYDGPPGLPEGSGETFMWYLENMPREPRQMLDWIIDYLGEDAPGWVEGKAGWFLITLLAYNAGDPEARASMYQALGLLAGTSVGSEIDGTRTLTFDAHLGSADDDRTSHTRYSLTVEMSTGLVQEIAKTSSVGEGAIPDSVPDSRIVYTMSVVDGLP